MASKRKFYKTIITVTVLSESPYEYDDLNQLSADIIDGDCSGQVYAGESKEIDGQTAAKELEAQGSDPGFFQLTADGEDTDEY